MADEPRGVEIENPVLGKLKVFGMDPNMLFTVFTFIAATAAAVLLYQHVADAKEADKSVAQVLKESNKEIAAILKESNKETNQILKDMAKEAKDMARDIRIQNCISSVPASFTSAQRAAWIDSCYKRGGN